MHDVNIRRFDQRDVPALLGMMRALAAFEGYIDDFKVSETELISQGLCDNPTFSALVAEQGNNLLGYAVFYSIPFTYDLRPTVIMKELYVTHAARGQGVGEALFQMVKTESKKLGAARLQWLVLPSNDPAKRFYQAQGGGPDHDWEHWRLAL